MTEDPPDVRLRKHIAEKFDVGSHDGRPVALSKSVHDEAIYLDDTIGMNAWCWALLHGSEGEDAPWWTGMHARDARGLVRLEAARLAAEAEEHGPELERLSGEYGALAELADRWKWSRGEVAKLFRSHAMVDAVKDVVEEQKTARAMAEATDGFSWTNLADDWDAEPPLPDRLARTDGFCGLYPGQRNLVVGYTESGKTWLELFALAQEIRAKRPVVLLDFENGESVVRSRLRALGLARDQVKTLLRYSFLSVPLSPEFAGEQARELWAEGARLMMVDALTPVAASMDLDLSGGQVNAVEQVYAAVLDPWVRVGFCGVMLDNTGKKDRAASSGSQHKDAAIGGSVLAVVSDKKSAAGRAGSSKIYLNKDRSGAVAHELAPEDKRLFGTMHVEPTGEDLVGVYVTPPPSPTVAATTAVADVIDIIAQTCALAAEAMRKHGVSEVRSMRRLAEMMGVVREIDPELYPVAHVHRDHITSCLTKVASGDDLTAAGIGVEARAMATSIRYRVWLL